MSILHMLIYVLKIAPKGSDDDSEKQYCYSHVNRFSFLF